MDQVIIILKRVSHVQPEEIRAQNFPGKGGEGQIWVIISSVRVNIETISKSLVIG